MTNSETSSPGQLPPIHKTIRFWLVLVFAVLSFGGFLDATYLAAKYYLGEPVVCSILNGCEKVTSSQYAAIFGIPVALLGSLYYLLIFVLTVIYLDSRNEKFFRLAAGLTPIGFLASLIFVYLQVFVIHALCLYCLISAATSTLLFIFSFFAFTKKDED